MNWLKKLYLRRRLYEDLDKEIAGHLEEKIEELVAAGMSRKEARSAAHRQFGNVELVKETGREAWGWRWVEDLLGDLGYGLRMLRKNAGFTTVAILTLALGIGANAAIFSVVNSALLRPLAYREPQQLYVVREIVPQLAKFAATLQVNIPDFRIWQKQVHSFADVAIAESTSADLTGKGEPEVVRGVRASANIFDVLGIQPALGRSFLPEEDETDRGNVVILTDAFWRARFQGDPAALKKTMVLDGVPRVIVGILPASFRFPAALGGSNRTSRLAFFSPLNGVKSHEQGLIGEFDFDAVARLRPGVTPDQALAELNTVQAQIAKQANEGVDLLAALRPLDSVVAGPARLGLIFLLGAVGVVLLIVCANLAGLLLSRAPGRMREAAIRVALGATRGRVIRQMLTETFLLSLAGGGLGVGICFFAVKWFVEMAPASIARLDEVQIDARVLGFALITSIATGCLFGILPALRVTHFHPLDNLKSGGSATTENRRTRRLREGLVGFEVALTTLLLILAGLLTASLGQLLRNDAVFGVQNVLVASVDLPPQSYSQPDIRLHFYDSALAGLQSLPGVRATGWISYPPLGGQGSVTGIRLPDEPQAGPEKPLANYRPVSPGYFSAMGIPLLKGRFFETADRGRNVVILSQSIAERFWPGKNPIGQTCVTEWGPDVTAQVVGVVGDIRTIRLDEPPVMMVYVPEKWFNDFTVPLTASFVLRTATDPAASSGSVRQVIHGMDPEIPITSLYPMTQIIAQSVDDRRFPMFLAISFAVFSLVLASLGIFGVVGYSVAQRRQELGIRRALGASSQSLVRMVLRQGLTPVTAGLLAGVVAAGFAGRLIRSLLFGVSAHDPVTFGIVVLVIALASVLACYVPARRAMRVDPMVALRYE